MDHGGVVCSEQLHLMFRRMHAMGEI
jgi:hypothetical protein